MAHTRNAKRPRRKPNRKELKARLRAARHSATRSAAARSTDDRPASFENHWGAVLVDRLG